MLESNNLLNDIRNIFLESYVRRYDDDKKFSYQDVDDFYGYLGYDYELEPLLRSIGIQSTSDLQRFLKENKVDYVFIGDFTEKIETYKDELYKLKNDEIL